MDNPALATMFHFLTRIVNFASGTSYTIEVSRTRRSDKLRCIDEMPEYLRFNRWIIRGYRSPDLTAMECVRSIVQVHNETINILSHVLPLVYLCWCYDGLVSHELLTHPLTYCHLVSCASSWLGSSVYHIFMNHRAGVRLYRLLLSVDMLGIWITQTFGALTTITASFIYLDNRVRLWFVCLYLLLSVNALYKSFQAREAWQRPFSFALLVAMRVLAFAVRMATHPSVRLSDAHIHHVIMQEFWPIFGSLLAIFRLPERFCWAGVLDYCLNSHNLMHVLVLFGGLHMHQAFLGDIHIILNGRS